MAYVYRVQPAPVCRFPQRPSYVYARQQQLGALGWGIPGFGTLLKKAAGFTIKAVSAAVDKKIGGNGATPQLYAPAPQQSYAPQQQSSPSGEQADGNGNFLSRLSSPMVAALGISSAALLVGLARR